MGLLFLSFTGNSKLEVVVKSEGNVSSVKIGTPSINFNVSVVVLFILIAEETDMSNETKFLV